MDTKTAFFYLFSTVLLFAAFMVITAKNMVHAALYLVLSFCQAAAIWVLLKSEFLALSLVLVYVGAVMVLFLFVVMMLDLNISTLRQGFWKHFPLAGTLGAIVAVELAAVLLAGYQQGEEPKLAAAAAQAELSNTKELGKVLYSAYIYPVQVAAVILLVAIIAAISLTLRQRKDSKYASPSDQVRVRPADRLVVLKMDATTAPAAKSTSNPMSNATSVSGSIDSAAIKDEGGKA
jgi:NADH-quinone oxidoreductase subunit J